MSFWTVVHLSTSNLAQVELTIVTASAVSMAFLLSQARDRKVTSITKRQILLADFPGVCGCAEWGLPPSQLTGFGAK